MAVVRILILLFITTGMAMAVLWHARQTVIVGYEITKMERKKAVLEERNRMLEDQISALRSPGNILKSLDEMDLELLPPGEGGGDLTSLVVGQRGRKGK
ncbi:MAG: hypothetical protein ACE5IC_06160 [Candidatus Brocadiales bacterium]